MYPQQPIFFAAFAAAALPAVLLSAVATTAACGRDPAPLAVADGGVTSDASDAADDVYDAPFVPPDAPVAHCTLDNGTDPVALCVQKLVLGAEHDAAFTKSLGVAESWDSTTFALDKDANDATLHDLHDDAAYAASAARYHARSEHYGDTELTPTLDADLLTIAGVLEKELAVLPDEYAGELYLDLRTAAGGLRFINQDDEATKLDALAEAYGVAIYDAHFLALPGADAGASDAGASDAIIGALAKGAAQYRPAAVATAALALLDLSVRHSVDAPAKAAAWQAAATAALDHIDARARDAATGLYFTELTTSADPEHDALVPSPLGADTLLTDVGGAIALAFLRAQDLVNNNGTALAAVASYPFEARADALLAALNGQQPALWDATHGGYLAGFSPSTSTLLSEKTTLANGLLLAALHRSAVLGSSPYGDRLKVLRVTMVDRTTAHASFLSAVPDQNGYFERVTPDFQLLSGDAGSGGHPASYTSRAISIAVEALDDQWYGLP